MNNQVKVKQQTECGSKNWGVYLNGRLVEGGFFSKGAALECARGWANGTEWCHGATEWCNEKVQQMKGLNG